MKTVLDEQYFKQMIEDAHLGIVFKRGTEIYNPLEKIPDILEEQPELYFTWLMSNPDYFYMACKVLFKIKIHPFQAVILRELWTHKFPMLVGSRGMSKSFSLALYALLRALFIPKRKILICSAGFRQAKIIFNYIESILSESPIMKDLILNCGNMNKAPEGWELKLGDSSIRAIPLGDGSRIRGLRANDILSDEFDSIPLDVFETVVGGFGAVSASPVENAGRIARKKLAERIGMIIPEEEEGSAGNQIVLSGTAGYSFKHFSKYHDRYRKIIKSRGNQDKLNEIFNNEIPPRGFDYRDFSVMRIPVDILPEGFMDDSNIARAKATVHSGIYQMEYCAVFSSDSNGFYPRSLIEKCTVKSEQDIKIKNVIIPAKEAVFKPILSGHPDYKYIMGIDPAMSTDNFAIVILEIRPNHRRVVYCWTTNEADYKYKKNNRLTTETNYYSYCIRKIRDLMRDFNMTAIAIDKDGGGRAILEGMNDEKVMKQGEIKLWPFILPNKQQDTDYHEGLHIIDVVNFSKEEFTSQSNHGMRKDMEEKELLFPLFDAISLAEADISQSLFDKADDEEKCIMEIEELKDELCTIVVTSTSISGRERFDTPEIKTTTGKKGRMRKDRYSALLMANMTARTLAMREDITLVPEHGGFADNRYPVKDSENGGKMYTGASWLIEGLADLYK